MAYEVNYTNSTKDAITVNDGELETSSTSLVLVGKNYARYGEFIAEDLLHLLENFANGSRPDNGIEGQIWYDTTSNAKTLRFHTGATATDGTEWKGIAALEVGTSAPADTEVQEGHLWYDSSVDKLKVYTGPAADEGWKEVGSQTGSTKIIASSIPDTTGTLHPVMLTVVDGKIVSIASESTFTVEADYVHSEIATDTAVFTGASGVFPTITKGINLRVADSDTDGHNDYVFSGTATSARYADLAERYWADAHYTPGHVIELGGEREITEATTELSTTVFGVVSTQPGLMLNAGAGNDETHPFVALAGRVPCKVVGLANKGDRLVTSEVPGHARAVREGELVDWTQVIGRALETKIVETPGSIEVVVGAK